MCCVLDKRTRRAHACMQTNGSISNAEPTIGDPPPPPKKKKKQKTKNTANAPRAEDELEAAGERRLGVGARVAVDLLRGDVEPRVEHLEGVEHVLLVVWG